MLRWGLSYDKPFTHKPTISQIYSEPNRQQFNCWRLNGEHHEGCNTSSLHATKNKLEAKESREPNLPNLFERWILEKFKVLRMLRYSTFYVGRGLESHINYVELSLCRCVGVSLCRCEQSGLALLGRSYFLQIRPTIRH